MTSQDFALDENIHGVRFNWNVFPSTRLEESAQVTPVGCLYSLLHKRPQELKSIPVSNTGRLPPRCKSCKSYINPFCRIDRLNGMWVCCICDKKSYFPPDTKLPTSELPEVDEWPIELQQVSSTIDHVLPVDITNPIDGDTPYSYMFLLDLYVVEGHQSEFDSYILKVTKAISELPEGSLMGIVGYHDSVIFANGARLSPTDIADDIIDLESDQTKKKTEKNNKTKKNKNLLSSLFSESVYEAFLDKVGVASGFSNSWDQLPLVSSKIFTQNKEVALQTIKHLVPKIAPDYKPPRVTGFAVYLASLLLSQCSFANFIGKLVLFSGGPCTSGPGMVADTKSPMRSHSDIVNMKAPYYTTSERFYRTLSYIANGHTTERALNAVNTISGRLSDSYPPAKQPRWSVDMFITSLDQVGVYEMKSLSAMTCGGIFLNDDYNRAAFGEGLTASLGQVNQTNGVLTVSTSQGLKVNKMLGNGCPLPPAVDGSDIVSKIGDQVTSFDPQAKKLNFTNQWQFNSLQSDNGCVAVYFQMDTANSINSLNAAGSTHVFIQFQLKYRDWESNTQRVRVTTLKKPTTLASLVANQVKMTDGTYRLVNSKSKVIKERDLLLSFDQKVWVVLFSRMLINKIDTDIGYDRFEDLLELIDETIIKILYHYGGVRLTQDSNGGNSSGDNNPYLMLKLIYEVNENFKQLPSLMYHLRKSQQLVRIFNSSPDETANYHHWFNRLNLSDSLLLLQPKLYKLTSDGHSKVIPLDSTCIRSPTGTFLIMDCLFQIIIYYVADGNNFLELHHSNNDQLVSNKDPTISRALEFIEENIRGHNNRQRPPAQIVVTQTNHSQARYFMSRLNKAESMEDSMARLALDDSNYKKKKSSKNRLKFLGWFDTNSVDNSYDVLKTDDLSLDEYFREILDLVTTYRVTDS
ncbi:uncharacterized protein KQ657_001122 [Scheffersomyces spartinae]|uniref:Protein transport protein SEC23 n=1 Tax=Scheffersomyces spartinae TaxID=45513 RepID=A0A9P7V8I3_9ASCO|nr:uncharacterized protein KQ657_001122 [Scheffersomyces spartinae]KAG7193009.1 hypothetical protein KQ657_001122 [Scheffersomyces spartinae]